MEGNFIKSPCNTKETTGKISDNLKQFAEQAILSQMVKYS